MSTAALIFGVVRARKAIPHPIAATATRPAVKITLFMHPSTTRVQAHKCAFGCCTYIHQNVWIRKKFVI
jgi:hypothetical protein